MDACDLESDSLVGAPGQHRARPPAERGRTVALGIVFVSSVMVFYSAVTLSSSWAARQARPGEFFAPAAAPAVAAALNATETASSLHPVSLPLSTPPPSKEEEMDEASGNIRASAAKDDAAAALNARYQNDVGAIAPLYLDTPIRLACLGGSATAGAEVPVEEQYCRRINSTMPEVTVAQEGHGSTNTLYAASLFSSLVARDTNFITWEYAINDVGFMKQDDNRVKALGGAVDDPVLLENHKQDEMFILDMFMQQVQHLCESTGAEPIPVVLIFLWDYQLEVMGPTSSGLKGRGVTTSLASEALPHRVSVRRTVLELLQQRIKAYPNIVGVVDVGQHVVDTCTACAVGVLAKEVGCEQLCSKKSVWLAPSGVHPTALVHDWISKEVRLILLQYMTGRHVGGSGKAVDGGGATAFEITPPSLPCISGSEEVLWRSVLEPSGYTMSYNWDLPAVADQGCEVTCPGCGQKHGGKEDPSRLDRQIAVYLPTCGEEGDEGAGDTSIPASQEQPLMLRFAQQCKVLGFSFWGHNTDGIRWHMPGYDLRYHGVQKECSVLAGGPTQEWMLATRTGTGSDKGTVPGGSEEAAIGGLSVTISACSPPPGEENEAATLRSVSVHCE